MSQASIKKTLDRLAYASLVLDICIAAITALSFFDQGSHQSLLVPINYLLTIVVALAIILFVLLLALRAKERQGLRRQGR
jgi:hypothetical protein